MRHGLAVAALLLSVCARAAGVHSGEAPKISASVEFLGNAGHTVTDHRGTTYIAGWWSYFEPKIYVEKYRGVFPLYFVGQTMRFKVTLANTAEKGAKPFNVLIEADNKVLETDGSLGQEIGPRQSWTVKDLRPGQTVTKEFSVYIDPGDDLPSGLDATKIRIRHANSGSADAGLIKESIAVWCPPDQAVGEAAGF
ncbi:MAG: hypothetical protein SF051_12430 [Elusimicrobiota bacterium]|nr:hypothetical protein [Elusimicrobiota bacterium]